MATDRPTSAASPAPTSDWTTQAADSIESVLGSVRDKTVKIETAARAVVYGIVIAVMGLAAMTVLTIILVRVLTFIPGAEVWMVDTGVGVLFTFAGLYLWRKRRPAASNP